MLEVEAPKAQAELDAWTAELSRMAFGACFLLYLNTSIRSSSKLKATTKWQRWSDEERSATRKTRSLQTGERMGAISSGERAAATTHEAATEAAASKSRLGFRRSRRRPVGRQNWRSATAARAGHTSVPVGSQRSTEWTLRRRPSEKNLRQRALGRGRDGQRCCQG